MVRKSRSRKSRRRVSRRRVSRRRISRRRVSRRRVSRRRVSRRRVSRHNYAMATAVRTAVSKFKKLNAPPATTAVVSHRGGRPLGGPRTLFSSPQSSNKSNAFTRFAQGRLLDPGTEGFYLTPDNMLEKIQQARDEEIKHCQIQIQQINEMQKEIADQWKQKFNKCKQSQSSRSQSPRSSTQVASFR